MNSCFPNSLPNTGLGIGSLLLAAGLLLIVGVMVLRSTRRPRGVMAAAIPVLLAFGPTGMPTQLPVDCETERLEYDWSKARELMSSTTSTTTSTTTTTTTLPPVAPTWTLRISAADNSWRSVTYGNGIFVATSISGSGTRVMTSTDGITWTTRSTTDNQFWSVAFGNGRFVAVSDFDSVSMTSTDGITWNVFDAPDAPPAPGEPGNGPWSAVTFGNGKFVAVAYDYNDIANLTMTSTDGESWTVSPAYDNNEWRSVTYGGPAGQERFVAVSVYSQYANYDPDTGITGGAEGAVMTSPDGVTWTLQSSPIDTEGSSWTSVTYGEGLFVAVGDRGSGNRVMTSPDGITWTLRDSPADNTWTSVTYGGGIFVAVARSGAGNRVMWSPDGITWTIGTSPADNSWRSVTYGGGIFVAVSSSGTGTRVMTSP